MGWLIFFSFFPVFIALRQSSAISYFVSGFTIGICWQIQLALSVLEWGYFFSLVVPALSGLIVGCCFYVTSILQNHIDESFSFIVFPSVWVVTTYAAEHWFYLPLSLQVSLSLEYPELLRFTQIIGSSMAEYVIAAVSSILVSLAIFGITKVQLSFAILLCVVVFSPLVFSGGSSNQSSKHKIYGIQPSIPQVVRKSTSWSIASRMKVEDVFDTLTKSALEKEAGLIVWPESGNGLPNLKSYSRRNKIGAMLGSKRHSILVSGTDFSNTGDQYNIASLFDSSGLKGTARKSITVPIAEQYITPGMPMVIYHDLWRVGVAICFEAIFSKHIETLYKNGANVLVGITNDASFGPGYLTDIHAAYAIARAISVRRSLVFLNNNGKSFVTDPNGLMVYLDNHGRNPGVYDWDVDITDSAAFSQDYGEIIALLSALFLLLIAISVKNK